MVRLRDIMTPAVVSLSPELSIRDAAELLAARHISGAPVVSKGRVIGVLSASDILQFLAALPGIPPEHPDKGEWGEWEDAPSWEEGSDPPAAFFTEDWDTAGVEASERFAGVRGPEWNTLEEHTVAEAMTRAPVCALPPGATVKEAAELMRRAGIHRVFVMEEERLVGVVTALDVARTVADGRIVHRTYVFPRRTD
jgi:CBS domain-containing protein